MNQRTSSNTGTTQDLSFLKGASPIYVTSLSGNNVTPTTTTDASSNFATITAASEANNNIAAIQNSSQSPLRTIENIKSNQANSRSILGKTSNSIDTNTLESKGTVFNGNIPNNTNNIHSSISAEKGVSNFCFTQFFLLLEMKLTYLLNLIFMALKVHILNMEFRQN